MKIIFHVKRCLPHSIPFDNMTHFIISFLSHLVRFFINRCIFFFIFSLKSFSLIHSLIASRFNWSVAFADSEMCWQAKKDLWWLLDLWWPPSISFAKLSTKLQFYYSYATTVFSLILSCSVPLFVQKPRSIKAWPCESQKHFNSSSDLGIRVWSY